MFEFVHETLSSIINYLLGKPNTTHFIEQNRQEYKRYATKTGLYLLPMPGNPMVAVCGPEAAKQVLSNSKQFPKMNFVGDKRSVPV